MTKLSVFGRNRTRKNLLVAAPPAGLREWYPGHWYVPKYGAQDNDALTGGGRIAAASWATLLTKLDQHPAIRGLMWRQSWLELEPTEGGFDAALDILEQRCAELAEIGKKFMVLIPTRTFSSAAGNSLANDSIAPTWARNATYDGGHYPYSMSATTPVGAGFAVCWYDAAVQAKMAILAEAIAARFINNPTFHGIGLGETSTPIRITTVTGGPGTANDLTVAQKDACLDGLFALTSAFRAAAPLKMCFQYINFSRDRMLTFVPRLAAAGIGLGGPDVFVDPNESGGLNQPRTPTNPNCGAYVHHRDYIDILPRLLNVQPYNYRYLKEERTDTAPLPTSQQLLNACKSVSPALEVNYLIWTQEFGGDTHARTSGVASPYPNFDSQVMTLLEAPAQTANPEGGLRATRPSLY